MSIVSEISWWGWFLIIFMMVFWSVEAYLFYYTDKPTLSRKVIQWTKNFPMLPFIFGLFIGAVAGHWWW